VIHLERCLLVSPASWGCCRGNRTLVLFQPEGWPEDRKVWRQPEPDFAGWRPCGCALERLNARIMDPLCDVDPVAGRRSWAGIPARSRTARQQSPAAGRPLVRCALRLHHQAEPALQERPTGASWVSVANTARALGAQPAAVRHAGCVRRRRSRSELWRPAASGGKGAAKCGGRQSVERRRRRRMRSTASGDGIPAMTASACRRARWGLSKRGAASLFGGRVGGGRPQDKGAAGASGATTWARRAARGYLAAGPSHSCVVRWIETDHEGVTSPLTRTVAEAERHTLVKAAGAAFGSVGCRSSRRQPALRGAGGYKGKGAIQIAAGKHRRLPIHGNSGGAPLQRRDWRGTCRPSHRGHARHVTGPKRSHGGLAGDLPTAVGGHAGPVTSRCRGIRSATRSERERGGRRDACRVAQAGGMTAGGSTGPLVRACIS